jgi:dethiobiotin synthetase
MSDLKPRLIFVTGTDTGVGKTLLAALLLAHLRQNGVHALAMKPFCSGSREDVEFLHAVQEGELTMDEINPFYFPEPIAPLVAGRRRGRNVRLNEVRASIQRVLARHFTKSARDAGMERPTIQHDKPMSTGELLLIEGSGGLLVPLGEGYSVAELIAALECEVLVVSRNRLGTLNHTLLTVKALRRARAPRGGARRGERSHVKVVLMEQAENDCSSTSNAQILAELLAPVPVFRLGFMGLQPRSRGVWKKNLKKIKKVLAQILG